jgi:hypothetical protein
MASFRVIRPNKKVLFPKGVQEELLLYIATNGPSAVYGTHTALNRSLSSIQTAMKRLNELRLVTFSHTVAGERGQDRHLFSLTVQGFCVTLLNIERQRNEGILNDFQAEDIIDALLTRWGALTPVTAEWQTLTSRTSEEPTISGERILEKCVDWYTTAAAFAALPASEIKTNKENGSADADVNVFSESFSNELMRAAKNSRNQEWIASLMTIAAEEMPLFYGVTEVSFTAEINRLLSEAEGLGTFLVARP